MRKAEVFVKGDQRFSGEGEFVGQILQEMAEVFGRKCLRKSQACNVDKLAAHVGIWCEYDFTSEET